MYKRQSLLQIAEIILQVQAFGRQHGRGIQPRQTGHDRGTLFHLVAQAGGKLLILVIDMAELLRQLANADHAVGMHDRHAFDQVGQLAHITCPVMTDVYKRQIRIARRSGIS